MTSDHDAFIPNRPSLSVGTWNVEFGRGVEKNRLRRELLTARDADVWVLTETHDELDLSPSHEPAPTDSRYASGHGGRWTTIWSRFPIVERIGTVDPSRTVCVRLRSASPNDGNLDDGNLDDGDLDVIVYGTVLPWMHDGTTGPDPKRAWSEFYRVTDEQGDEWRALRQRFPDAALVVAGDLNHNLGGPHYYGTNQGRTQLRAALAAADLACLTEAGNLAPGQLTHPPIDHVCVAPPSGRTLASTAEGWEKTTADGVTLSDHSGVLARVTFG
jgi:hypothetical protein